MRTLSIVTKRVATLAKGVIVMGVAVFGWGTAAGATETETVERTKATADKVEVVKVDLDRVASSIKRVLSGQAAGPSIPEIGAPVQFTLTGLPSLMPASLPGVRTRTKVSRTKTEKKGKVLVAVPFYHLGGGNYSRNPGTGTNCEPDPGFPCIIEYQDEDDVTGVNTFNYSTRPAGETQQTDPGIWM